jgi:glycosyltransferase involved in cell wall biosynthesis
LGQTYKNIEVIVVNDGSTDSDATEKVAKAYGKKIRYINKQNGGVATALNLGIEKMTGTYFSWLSHDDMYENTKIEYQIARLNKLQNKDVIIASNVKVLFKSGIKKKEKIDKNAFSFIDIFLATSAKVGLNGCSLLIPKRAFEICGYFDQNLLLTQDYDLWFRMKDKFRFELLDKFLVISRRHSEQGSVVMQENLINAGDNLHSKFLKNIPYSRFEEYFKCDKRNIDSVYENYKVYMMRGYKKTPSLIMKNMLRYCHENDKDKFYQVFSSELDSQFSADPAIIENDNYKTSPTSKNLLASSGHERIEIEYAKLLSSGTDDYPLNSHAAQKKPLPKNKLLRVVRKLNDSIGRDGVYLTAEKIIRETYAKLRSRK